MLRTVRIACVLASAVLFSISVPAQYSSPPSSPAGGRLRWPEGKRTALSLSFDDARPSQVDNGVPLFAKYGTKVTFYVSPSGIPQRLDAWKKAAAAGHEIGNHSMNHPCSGNFTWSRGKALEEYTLEKMRGEIEGANREIGKLLNVTPGTFAYPCGQKYVGRGIGVKSYIPLVAEYFSAGRGWLDEAANDPLYCDMAQLLAIPMDNVDFARLKPILEQAVQNGQWVVLAGHDIGEGDKPQTTLIAMLDELCRYAMNPANGIWLDTVQAVASYVRQKR
jgi:peptidoglycan-N-acetylglucosamine deacetylase